MKSAARCRRTSTPACVSCASANKVQQFNRGEGQKFCPFFLSFKSTCYRQFYGPIITWLDDRGVRRVKPDDSWENLSTLCVVDVNLMSQKFLSSSSSFFFRFDLFMTAKTKKKNEYFFIKKTSFPFGSIDDYHPIRRVIEKGAQISPSLFLFCFFFKKKRSWKVCAYFVLFSFRFFGCSW